MPMMKRKRTRLSDQIRQAVDACVLSRYRICKETGIDQGAFSRFMAGKVGLTMAHLDAVADLLRLDVVARGKPDPIPEAKRGPKPKGR